jgi:hypothetical protein
MKLGLRDTCFLCYDDDAFIFAGSPLRPLLFPSHQAKPYYVVMTVSTGESNTYGMLLIQFLDQNCFFVMQSQEHITTWPRAWGEDLALVAGPNEMDFFMNGLLQSHRKVVMI